MNRPALLIVAVLLTTPCPAAQAVPKTDAGAVAQAARPGKAAIASSHQLATDAGLEVLAKGGNAFDAAIAVGAALAVIEPQSSGIGGGGFFLLHRADNGKDVFLDARERAPAESRSELWADANGKLDKDKSVNGPLSAGIPGEPA
ncbi:MAG: gamma-glutamyltransferase, partial [Dokdonella sp.]